MHYAVFYKLFFLSAWMVASYAAKLPRLFKAKHSPAEKLYGRYTVGLLTDGPSIIINKILNIDGSKLHIFHVGTVYQQN